MTLHIKNMVCVRCKMAVKTVLEEIGIPYSSVELGRVQLPVQLSPAQLQLLDMKLRYYELELMSDSRAILTERIKTLILSLLSKGSLEMEWKLSAYLSASLEHDYTYLANVFSSTEGCTIERFFIVSRVEKAKELMIYEGLSIAEVTHRLNYSSVSHFSLQFKKVTGLTPAYFKKLCERDDYIWRPLKEPEEITRHTPENEQKQ
jgi:AraC family transcriptional regulator